MSQLIKVKYSTKENKRLNMPDKGDVGIDLFASGTTFIPLGEVRLIHTGISIELPEGYWFQLLDRSSISKYCHVLAGVVDNSYRGEVCIRMLCHSVETVSDGYLIEDGFKVAQGIIRKDYTPEFKMLEVEELSNTSRGSDGFGSTGYE